MGLGAVAYLRTLYPKANIIYALPQWVAPLYSDSEVETDATAYFPLELKSTKDFIKTFFKLKKLNIDHIHEMHQTGTGAKFFAFVAFIFGIKYTAHNHHLKTKTQVLDQGLIKPLIQRDLDGVYSFLGIPGEIPHYLNYEPEIKIKNSIKCKRIIFGVVATRHTKMWPLENYVMLAELILKENPECEIAIPLSKSENDRKIKAELIRLGLPEVVKFVESELKKLPKFFSESSFYFGNDTGLKHIAVAVNLKSFTLFGPEPANEWHPYETTNHQYFFEENLSCRTRKYHYCGLETCDLLEENMQCMKKFTPEKAFLVIKPYM